MKIFWFQHDFGNGVERHYGYCNEAHAEINNSRFIIDISRRRRGQWDVYYYGGDDGLGESSDVEHWPREMPIDEVKAIAIATWRMKWRNR